MGHVQAADWTLRNVGPPETIVSEQPCARRRRVRISGSWMCSKLIAEIKSAETTSSRFLSRSGKLSETKGVSHEHDHERHDSGR